MKATLSASLCAEVYCAILFTSSLAFISGALATVPIALDSGTIDTKLGQIKAISKEYGGSIGAGATDTEALLKEMHIKFEQAGNQEIIDEIQRQVDEFVANK